MGHYSMVSKENDEDLAASNEYQQQLDNVLTKGQNPGDTKILSFMDKAPSAMAGR